MKRLKDSFLKYKISIVLFTLSLFSYGQECSIYKNTDSWKISKDVLFNISYVSCFHAEGVVTSFEYSDIETGFHIMDKGHHNASYFFSGYNFVSKEKLKLNAGILYRMNNQPSLMLCHWGGNIRLYKSFWFTARVLQVNKNVSYLNVGLKVSI